MNGLEPEELLKRWASKALQYRPKYFTQAARFTNYNDAVDPSRPDSLQHGDHIFVVRSSGLFAHHGIFVREADGCFVIHLCPNSGPSTLANTLFPSIQKTTIDAFRGTSGWADVGVMTYLHQDLNGRSRKTFVGNTRPVGCFAVERQDPNEVVAVAKYVLENEPNARRYSLFAFNCEHFAHFCSVGPHRYASQQIENLKGLIDKVPNLLNWSLGNFAKARQIKQSQVEDAAGTVASFLAMFSPIKLQDFEPYLATLFEYLERSSEGTDECNSAVSCVGFLRSILSDINEAIGASAVTSPTWGTVSVDVSLTNSQYQPTMATSAGKTRNYIELSRLDPMLAWSHKRSHDSQKVPTPKASTIPSIELGSEFVNSLLKSFPLGPNYTLLECEGSSLQLRSEWKCHSDAPLKDPGSEASTLRLRLYADELRVRMRSSEHIHLDFDLIWSDQDICVMDVDLITFHDDSCEFGVSGSSRFSFTDGKSCIDILDPLEVEVCRGPGMVSSHVKSKVADRIQAVNAQLRKEAFKWIATVNAVSESLGLWGLLRRLAGHVTTSAPKSRLQACLDSVQNRLRNLFPRGTDNQVASVPEGDCTSRPVCSLCQQPCKAQFYQLQESVVVCGNCGCFGCGTQMSSHKKSVLADASRVLDVSTMQRLNVPERFELLLCESCGDILTQQRQTDAAILPSNKVEVESFIEHCRSQLSGLSRRQRFHTLQHAVDVLGCGYNSKKFLLHHKSLEWFLREVQFFKKDYTYRFEQKQSQLREERLKETVQHLQSSYLNQRHSLSQKENAELRKRVDALEVAEKASKLKHAADLKFANKRQVMLEKRLERVMTEYKNEKLSEVTTLREHLLAESSKEKHEMQSIIDDLRLQVGAQTNELRTARAALADARKAETRAKAGVKILRDAMQSAEAEATAVERSQHQQVEKLQSDYEQLQAALEKERLLTTGLRANVKDLQLRLSKENERRSNEVRCFRCDSACAVQLRCPPKCRSPVVIADHDGAGHQKPIDLLTRETAIKGECLACHRKGELQVYCKCRNCKTLWLREIPQA